MSGQNSRFSPLRVIVAALAITVFSSQAPAHAEVRELTIPIDEETIGERAFSDDPLVALSGERYTELLRKVREKRSAAPAPPGQPRKVSSVRASYIGTATADRARFEAVLRYHLLEEGIQELALCHDDVSLESVVLLRGPDGPTTLLPPAARGRVSRLQLSGPGEVELQIRFSLPIRTDRGKSSLAFKTPLLPVRRLRMRLPTGASGISIGGLEAVADLVSRDEGDPVIAVDLPPLGPVSLQWYTSSGAGPAEAAVTPSLTSPDRGGAKPGLSARTDSLFVVGDEVISMRHEMEVLITRKKLARLRFDLPADLEVQELTGPEVAGHRTLADGGQKTLEVIFREPHRGETRITLTGYQLLGKREKFQPSFPRISASGVDARQHGSFGIASFSTLDLTPVTGETDGIRPIDPGDLPSTLVSHSATPILLAYRYPTASPSMTLAITRLARAEVLPAVIENANAVTILTEVERDREGKREKRVTSFTKVILQVACASRDYLAVQLDRSAKITSCLVDLDACSPAIGAEPGQYLIPIPRSRIAKNRLQAYPVQLTYQLDLPVGFDQTGNLGYRLPSFDLPVADYSWKVFTPEKYRFVRFRGDLQDTAEDVEFVMVAAAKWLLDRLLYDVAAGSLAIGFIFFFLFTLVRMALAVLRGTARPAATPMLLLAGVCFIIIALAAISVPNFRAARERANVRACYANQKTIAGAVEMYNLDNNTLRTDVGLTFLDELVEGGYLQTIPRDPGQGSRSGSNYHAAHGGAGIACQVHGSIPGSGARIYGFEDPVSSSSHDHAHQNESTSPKHRVRTARDDRMNPINFRIPRTGQYTLLLRGFLPAGQTPEFEASYFSRQHFLQVRMLCWLTGLVLAFLLIIPAASGRSMTLDVAALGAFLAALLGIDAYSPALASEAFAAWSIGILTGTVLVIFKGRLMKALFLAGTLTCLSTAPAQAAPDLEVRVYRPAGTSETGERLIARSSLLELVREASRPTQQATRSAMRAKRGASARIEEAVYRVHPEATRARIEARYTLRLTGKGWKKLNLAGAGVRLASSHVESPVASQRLLPDGKPGQFLIDGEGVAQVVQTMTARVDRQGDRFRMSCPVPSAAINSVVLASESHDGLQVSRGVVDTASRTGWFPPGSDMRLQWTAAGRERGVDPASADTSSVSVEPRIESGAELIARVGERSIRLEGLLSIDVRQRPVVTTRIELPAELTVIDVRSPLLAGWTVTAGDSRRKHLSIEWASPLQAKAEVTLVAELLRQGDGAYGLGLPSVEGAHRETITLAVAAQRSLKLTVEAGAEGLRSLDLTRTPPSIRASLGGTPKLLYSLRRYAGMDLREEPSLAIQVERFRQVRVLAAVADLAEVQTHVGRDGIVMGRARYLVKNNTEQYLRLRLPEGARVLDSFVSGTAVAPGSTADGELLIPLEKSGVRNTQAAAFPVEVTYLQNQKPLRDGDRITFKLPRVHLPVSTVRWNLSLPPELEALPVAGSLQSDTYYREVSYAGDAGEDSGQVRTLRLFEETAPPLRVPFPEMQTVSHFSQDIVDSDSAAPYLEARIVSRQTARFHSSLAFALALLMAFGIVFHGVDFRGRRSRSLCLLLVSGIAVGVTSFQPESLALGLYFALGLFLGVAVALVRWTAEWRPALG